MQPLDTNEAVCEYTQCGTIPNIWWSSTHMQCATIDTLPFVDNTLDSMIVGTNHKSTETVDIASNTSCSQPSWNDTCTPAVQNHTLKLLANLLGNFLSSFLRTFECAANNLLPTPHEATLIEFVRLESFKTLLRVNRGHTVWLY